eukprot:467145_1
MAEAKKEAEYMSDKSNYKLSKLYVPSLSKCIELNKDEIDGLLYWIKTGGYFHEHYINLCLSRVCQLAKENREKLFSRNKTREDWMMKVVFLALHKYNCTIIGGFVRDYIVRGEIPNDIDIVLPAGMTINEFQSKMTKIMKDIGVKFEPGPCNTIDGHKFKVNGFSFEADLAPHNLHVLKSCDVDVSNLQLKINQSQNGHIRLEQRVKKSKSCNSNTDEIIKNIFSKKCNIIDDFWMDNLKHKRFLKKRLKNKYLKRGWRIMNEYEMNKVGLWW